MCDTLKTEFYFRYFLLGDFVSSSSSSDSISGNDGGGGGNFGGVKFGAFA